MPKIILFNMISLDGFFEGPGRDISWHNVDDEFNEFAIEQLDSAGGLIFGRLTYQLMAGYWPTPAAAQDDPIVAAKMNGIPKIVFSRTLDKVEWNNTRLVKEDAAAEITRLKQHPGNDLYIFGSGNLSAAFIRDGLINEYRLIVSPLVLGQGTPLFKDLKEKLPLKLMKARTFRNGNVLLYYQPAGK